jgi:hypothetical protein
MKVTLTKSMFRDEFKRMGRADQFSYDALGAMFDYFEEWEPEMELDVVGICCEYSELTFVELIEQYDIPIDSDYGQSEESQIIDWLTDHTSIVAVLDDRVVFYASF